MLRYCSPWRKDLRRGAARRFEGMREASTRAQKTAPTKPTPKGDQGDQGDQDGQAPSNGLRGQTPVRGRYGDPLTWLVYAGAFWLGTHVFVNYFYSTDICHGISMLPTIASYGEWIWISKYYRRGRGINIGDLITFKSPIVVGEQAVKRVIGLPGDFVLMDTPGKSDAMIQVPEGHCWVTGDNLLHSRDSRAYGPLPMALIKGKVIAKYNFHRYYPSGFAWMDQGLQPAVQDEDID